MGFPSRYIQGPGALKQTGQLLSELGFKRPVLLCDETVRKVALPILRASLDPFGHESSVVVFPGEITLATVADCNQKVAGHRPDVVVGLGGGKAVDAAKAAAANLDVPVVIAPTVASNDAPTSRLIVINDQNRTPVQIDFLKLNPTAILVDTDIIVKAPVRFFAAGIGDAISKSLEANQCAASGGVNFFGTPPSATAIMLSDQCFSVILKHAVTAYDAVKRREITPEVEELVEATVLLSGLGFESGGLSLAHALIRGITAIPSMGKMLHGEMVAFGALVQSVVENRQQQELEQLLAIFAHTKLPTCFAEFGYEGRMCAADLDKIVSATLAHTYAANMTPPLTAERLRDALLKTNELGMSARDRNTFSVG
ncbi:glycerol dehydrogenase [Marinovum sp. 2_MG-2023]|uniref:glycerol dehydrogenase n=1 Tax=unclassified Marinovum TaxID=2647166 RepID=UPI0026E36CD3|nr:MULTISPECIES: glycerol dehydrogenase [unclassified Marinovum]MDO6731847.1 glycerol dehydrogenase [Marinovum sp. 2_MG-2023]MDO6781099.1 glycerol dehydrogenase [Marinovum sp. 1_MG-2023]